MKNAEYYLNLPYSKIVKKITDDSGEYWYGRILEIPECQSTGDTLEELEKSLDEALELCIEIRLEEGEDVPEPAGDEYSGKFVVRIPKSLHQSLALQAKEEGVSLNQYALYKLSK